MKANQHPIGYQTLSPNLKIFLHRVVLGLIMALALNRVLSAQTENAPPEARFITLPSAPIPHQPMTFAAVRSYDPDGTIIDFIWDFGDGHIGAGLQVEHTYESPGVYPVTLIVVDSMGAEGTAMGEVQVEDRGERGLPFNVMLEVNPVIPSASTPILFTAYPLPEQDAEPMQYFWDFGDRNFGEMPVEEHAYQGPGDYHVALTLTGERGETVTDFLILSIADNREKNGLLEGIVFHDLDANGRQDEGEPGLGDWEVTFMGPDTGVLNTDADGRFLQEVALGTYQLSVDGKEGWTFTNMARPEVPVPAGRAGKVSVAVQQQNPTPPTPEEINPQDPPTLDPNIQCQCHCSAEIIGSDHMDWNQLSKVVYTVRSNMDGAAWLQSTGQRFGAGAVPWYNNVQWSVDQPAPTDPSQAVTLTCNGATVSVTIPAVGRQIGQQVTFTLRASFMSWGLCLDEESNTYNTVKFTCSASKKVTLTASCEDLVKDIARLQGEIMQLKRDIRGFEQQVTAKQNKLNAGLQTLDKELVERKKQLANLDQQLQSARQNLSTADTSFKTKGLDFVKIDTALKSCHSGLGSARFALTKLIRPIRSKIFNQWVLNQGSSVYTYVSSMQNDLTNTQELTEERLKALTSVVKDFLDTVYPEKRDLILVPDDLLNPSHANEVYLLMTQHKLATLTRVAPSLVQLGSLIQ